MKYYQIIVEFRKAYMKLNYLKNKMTVNELFIWTENWCRNNGIPNVLVDNFKRLVLAYIDKEWHEKAIEKGMKKYFRASIVIC